MAKWVYKDIQMYTQDKTNRFWYNRPNLYLENNDKNSDGWLSWDARTRSWVKASVPESGRSRKESVLKLDDLFLNERLYAKLAGHG